MPEARWALNDETFMDLALEQAKVATQVGEVPVGAVLVHRDGTILARSRNRREELADPTAHAEVLSIRSATGPQNPGRWRLPDTCLYVSLEPCILCMGAILHARIPRLVFGADDAKAGAAKSLYSLGQDPRLNHQLEIVSGIRALQCSQLLQQFFAELRATRR